MSTVVVQAVAVSEVLRASVRSDSKNQSPVPGCRSDLTVVQVRCHSEMPVIRAAPGSGCEHPDAHGEPGGLVQDTFSRDSGIVSTIARVPATDVRVWRTPNGTLALVQDVIDHNGPAPPQPTAA